jgi:hypothetical protein
MTGKQGGVRMMDKNLAVAQQSTVRCGRRGVGACIAKVGGKSGAIPETDSSDGASHARSGRAGVRYGTCRSRPLLGRLAAAIVARGGLDLGVTGELLHRAEIGAGIKKVADKRPPQVVRREGRHAGLGGALAGDVQHGLPRHPPCPQLPALIDRDKQRPRPESADRQPRLERRLAGIAQMRQALLVALTPYL